MTRQQRRRRRRRRRFVRSSLVIVAVAAGVTALLLTKGPSSISGSRTVARRGVVGDALKNVTSTSESTTTMSTTTTTTTVPDETTGLFATASIQSYLGAQDDDINAAVYDLHTGQLSLYRPGALEYTASIVKVDILAALLYQAAQPGSGLSDAEQDLATTMIENSDDDAASDLWDDIDQQTGLAAFNALIPLPDTVPGTDGHWGGTTTTGEDQISLLRQLVQPSTVLASSAQSYELGLMENVESDQAWGVSAGVPDGVTVALKNGWLPLEGDVDWQVNSIGWIDGDGQDYLIAVLTKNNDSEGSGITAIEGLSSLVWNALASGSA